MIYVFEDGRTIYNKEFLLPRDHGKYIEVAALPDIPNKEDKIGYIVANLATGELEFRYTNIQEIEQTEPPIPPQYQPTNAEIAQTQLTMMEAMADQYEQNLQNQLTNMEVQATIYETLLEQGGTTI